MMYVLLLDLLCGANLCEGFGETLQCNNVLNCTSEICQSSFVKPLRLTKYTNLSRISCRQVMCLGMFFLILHLIRDGAEASEVFIERLLPAAWLPSAIKLMT